jgi:hypothetical protein
VPVKSKSSVNGQTKTDDQETREPRAATCVLSYSLSRPRTTTAMCTSQLTVSKMLLEIARLENPLFQYQSLYYSSWSLKQSKIFYPRAVRDYFLRDADLTYARRSCGALWPCLHYFNRKKFYYCPRRFRTSLICKDLFGLYRLH